MPPALKGYKRCRNEVRGNCVILVKNNEKLILIEHSILVGPIKHPKMILDLEFIMM
jgi:hypothetical protein